MKLPGNAFHAAIDLKIFTTNMLILELLHAAPFYLFWMKSQGSGTHGFYKLSSVVEMMMAFGFLSPGPPMCGFLLLLHDSRGQGGTEGESVAGEF